MDTPFIPVGYILATAPMPEAMERWTQRGYYPDHFVIDAGRIVAITARTETRFGTPEEEK